MSLNILSGKYKGRPLLSPKSKTRPTTSLLRKSIFDRIQQEIEDASFCDLFAGSGSVGLEALSRGASYIAFAESDRTTYECLKKNIAAFEPEICYPYFGKAHLFLQKLEHNQKTFDFIYLDPPYDISNANPSSYPNLIAYLDTSTLLKKGGTLFVENDKKDAPYLHALQNLELTQTRGYSDSYLHVLTKKL